MNILKILLVFIFAVFSHNAVAYGSSSSKKACKKPKFSQFTPPHLSDVSPQTEFSFTASAKTLANSIQVTVKNKPIDVVVSEKSNKLLVTGKLPADLHGTHARITIRAIGTNKCKGSDGWLVKIADE